MSELDDRTADVFEQLSAFGQTLEANTAEPISPDPELSPSRVRFTDDGVTIVDLETSVPREPRRKVPPRVLVAGLVAAAVVVAIALVVTRAGDDAVPADQPAPTAPPRALPNVPPQPLVPGTYFVDEVSGTPTPRIFATIGDGWWDRSTDAGWGLMKGGPWLGEAAFDEFLQHEIGFMGFANPVAVYSDACHWEDGYHPGPVDSVDGLVAALTEQQGWAEFTVPSDISVDGYAGKAFQRTAPADMSDCSTRFHGTRTSDGRGTYPDFRSWETPDGDFGGGAEPGQIETLWVLDIDGTVVVISTGVWSEPSAGADPDFAADVLDSIRIDRRFDSMGADVVTPLALVRGSQSSGADVELFRVTTDEPTYWRLAALPEFDGRTWGLPDSPLSPIDDTADPPPGGHIVRQQLQILGLQGQLLPAAADPTQVEPNTDIRFNADTSTLVTLSGLASGDQFTIVSKAPDVTLDELRAATNDNPPDELVLELPDDLPGVVSDLATEVTAGAATDYDRLIALQDWFTNEFNYDLPAAASDDAIEMFLQTRSGASEQFASTFAVMARALGIPSRVAVGFTPGELNVDGSYSVFGKNSHAWPEVWFDGIGWVAFEPTPQRAIPGVEDLPHG